MQSIELNSLKNIFTIWLKSVFVVGFSFVLALYPQSSMAQTTVPSNLQVVGTITGANSVNPETNDIVQVVRPTALGTVEGQGTVLGSDGTYFIDMSKTQAFNGTVLTMLLKKGTRVYQLNSGSNPVQFPYSGTFPFPARLVQGVTIGTLLSGGSSGGGGGSGGGDGSQNDQFDVNGDGTFNQTDVNIIKSNLGKSRPDAAMDVNEDGVVNTRDVIDAIRALNSARNTRVRGTTTPASSSSTTSSSTTP